MITVNTPGSFKRTEDFLNKLSKQDLMSVLNHYGQVGVNALASVTPVDTGLTANSWTYEIVKTRGRYSLAWHNTNRESGVPVAILLQYGHATGSGGWVEGHDYINPAIRPVFDQITTEVWKQVTNG